jgi:hypothetical protein
MNKFFVGALASAGLMAVAAGSQAQDVTYQLLTGTTAYSTPPTGVAPTTTSSPDPGLFDFFVPVVPNPVTFATPSVLAYGDDMTSAGSGAPNTFATWNNVPVQFKFMVDAGPANAITANAQEFEAEGILNGTVGYNGSGVHYSQASVTYSTILDLTDPGYTSALGTDPNNSSPAVDITALIDGVTVTLYLDEHASKAIPGGSPVSHTGYVTATSVPEPGAVAMIVGMGVGGGIFLRRKRRA